MNVANGDTIIHKNGIFIVCEGNYNWGNGSICYYDFSTKHISLNLFQQINARPLGDVPQSMTINGNKAYIIVNNSNKIEVVDMPSFKSLGTISGINSPRYIIFISDSKAYVSSLYGNVIYIINPQSMKVIGTIATGTSTEQLLWVNDEICAANWSNGNKIFVINPNTDAVVSTIITGKEPCSMVLDKHNKLWVLCSGGYLHDENATLIKFNSLNFEKEKTYQYVNNSYPTKLCVNATKDSLFFLNNGIYKLSIYDAELPVQPFVFAKNRNFYGLITDPYAAQFIVSNTVDYVQQGLIYRYSNNGSVLDSCKVDINPGEFCFN